MHSNLHLISYKQVKYEGTMRHWHVGPKHPNLDAYVAQLSLVLINYEGHEDATQDMHSAASGNGIGAACDSNEPIDDIDIVDEGQYYEQYQKCSCMFEHNYYYILNVYKLF